MAGYFGLRPSLFLLPENHVIFFSRFKAKIIFLNKVKASFFCCFFVCFFYNHIIQPNYPELLIQAY